MRNLSLYAQGELRIARDFCWRTNKRRDLTSQQWSALAVEDEELVKVIQEETERQRREKQAETQKVTQTKEHGELSDNLLSDSRIDEHENTVVTKLAKQFKTNRTYVNKARKLKVTAPEKFEAVKEGRTTYEQIEKEERTRQRIEQIIEDATHA